MDSDSDQWTTGSQDSLSDHCDDDDLDGDHNHGTGYSLDPQLYTPEPNTHSENHHDHGDSPKVVVPQLDDVSAKSLMTHPILILVASPQPISWPSPRFCIVSRIVARSSMGSTRETDDLIRDLNELLDSTGRMPANHRDLHAAESTILKKANLQVTSFVVPPAPRDPSTSLQMAHVDRPECVHYSFTDIVQDILNDPEHCTSATFRYTRNSSSPVISHITSGQWWRNEEAKLPRGGNILGIILAMDESHITLNGRYAHPVYLTVANLHRDHAQKAAAIRLYALLPTVRILEAYRSNERVKKWKQKVLFEALQVVIAPIVEHHSQGIVFNLKLWSTSSPEATL